MAQEEQNRSEAPTHFKLEHARRKGQVARGLDLSFLTGLAAFLGFCWVEGAALVRALASAMHDALITSSQLAGDQGTVFAVTARLGGTIERPLLILAGTVFAVVLLFELLQTGFVLSSEPLKMDFSRMNPAQGLKRLFTVRLLIETAKNVLKLAVYTAAAWLVLRNLLASEVGSISDGASLLRVAVHVATRLLLVFAGGALFYAILDQIIARRNFLKQMRMSRRELKQEVRDREGEPRLKQKRKQMHAEFARAQRSLKGLRGADMMIVNPHHIAIALRYDPSTMGAPKVVSLGTDNLALRLKRLALLYGIPVFEDRELARALFKGAALERSISPNHYRPVANLYNRLRRSREGKA